MYSHFYLIVVTISTVGFGDLTAKSVLGKTLIVLAALWGAFLVSLVVLVVA